MPSYDWRDFEDRGPTPPADDWKGIVQSRFPEWAQGRETISAADSAEAALKAVITLRHAGAPENVPSPCVFVSHRKTDVAEASRIAYLACHHGFDYWLDVLDPTLNALSATNPGVQATVIALVIEMGLLNSTHVCAVITKNTRGSGWVPYEYGRVKDDVPVSPQAACWIATSVPSSDIPEYLYLGVVTRDEAAIDSWLGIQAQCCKAAGTCLWTHAKPAQLP